VMSLRVMIVKSSPWDLETFYTSEHPEYVAIRNIVLQNPEHDFILVGHGLRFQHFKSGNVQFYNLGSGNKFRYMAAFSMNLWLPLFLRPSVVISMVGIDLVPMKIGSWLVGAKFIPTLVGDVWYSLSDVPKSVRKLCKALLKASFQGSYAILSISESIKRELRIDYGIKSQKVYVFKYSISKIFNPHVSRDLQKTLNPNGPVALTVCRISPQKGLSYLVEASPSIISKIPNVRFVIRSYSSDEKYERFLTELINKYNVREYFKIIKEFSPYEQIPKYMVAGDVFVLPSVSEGNPVVILEAMACGVPVVASNVGGIPDILKDGYNGLLVKTGDVEGLAAAVTKILSDETLRKRLSEGALTTIQHMTENEFEALLNRLIFDKLHPSKA
jgi:glycosyltransferase involved in cell wall biosynthesis